MTSIYSSNTTGSIIVSASINPPANSNSSLTSWGLGAGGSPWSGVVANAFYVPTTGFGSGLFATAWTLNLGYNCYNDAGTWVAFSNGTASDFKIGSTYPFMFFYNSSVSENTSFTQSNIAYVTTAGAWTTVSSAQLKDNVEGLTDCSWLYNLRPVTFDWIDGRAGHSLGLIAEEVYEQEPMVVSLDKDGLPHGISYGLLTVPIVSEMKKLRGRIIELEEKVKTLTTTITST